MHMPRSSATKPTEVLTYEAAFAELQGIVAALEGEPSSLDEAMSLFERGQALVKRCTQLLDEAEAKIFEIAEGGQRRCRYAHIAPMSPVRPARAPAETGGETAFGRMTSESPA